MPPRRRQALVCAGFLGAAAAGFVSHWAIPIAVREAPGAQAATSVVEDKRLIAMELKLEEVLRQIVIINGDMRAVKCRLNIENTCPPEPR